MEVHVKVARLEEKFDNFEKSYEKDISNIRSQVGGIFKRIEDSIKERHDQMEGITERLFCLDKKIEQRFKIDMKKILLGIFMACFVYLCTEYIKAKLKPQESSKIILELTEGELKELTGG